jgi:hypothetical protein
MWQLPVSCFREVFLPSLYYLADGSYVKLSTYACMFWNQVEEQSMICFFKLKWMKAKNIDIALKLVNGPEAIARPTVKKSRRRFHQDGTDLCDNPRSRKPVTNALGEAIDLYLQSGHSFRERFCVATSRLKRRYVCESSTSRLVSKEFNLC